MNITQEQLDIAKAKQQKDAYEAENMPVDPDDSANVCIGCE